MCGLEDGLHNSVSSTSATLREGETQSQSGSWQAAITPTSRSYSPIPRSCHREPSMSRIDLHSFPLPLLLLLPLLQRPLPCAARDDSSADSQRRPTTLLHREHLQLFAGKRHCPGECIWERRSRSILSGEERRVEEKEGGEDRRIDGTMPGLRVLLVVAQGVQHLQHCLRRRSSARPIRLPCCKGVRVRVVEVYGEGGDTEREKHGECTIDLCR